MVHALAQTLDLDGSALTTKGTLRSSSYTYWETQGQGAKADDSPVFSSSTIKSGRLRGIEKNGATPYLKIFFMHFHT